MCFVLRTQGCSLPTRWSSMKLTAGGSSSCAGRCTSPGWSARVLAAAVAVVVAAVAVVALAVAAAGVVTAAVAAAAAAVAAAAVPAEDDRHGLRRLAEIQMYYETANETCGGYCTRTVFRDLHVDVYVHMTCRCASPYTPHAPRPIRLRPLLHNRGGRRCWLDHLARSSQSWPTIIAVVSHRHRRRAFETSPALSLSS